MTNRVVLAALWLLAALSPHDAGAIDRHRIWHQGREIEVIDRGGWAVFEDDIIVGRIDAALAKANTLAIGALTLRNGRQPTLTRFDF